MKKHNFYAGPSILSEYTIKNTADAILNFSDTGLSVLEVSHRSKEFQAVMDEAVALVKELLDIPQGYSVLFLGGGASMQFCMVPYNLLEHKAAYLETGTWASNAIKEARLFGDVEVVASSKDANFTYIPKGYTVPDDVDKKGSMFNTPPVLPIFSALQTLRYYKQLGGVARLEQMDLEKAARLYDAIDSSRMFEGTVTDPADRSIMNVCFVMTPEYKELEKDFVDFASSKGIVGIKGHRSVGGFRASLYNALPMESVEVLVAAMKEFESKH